MKVHKPNLISMGNGTPVVLLHSAMSSKLQWYKLMSSMSRNYLMIAVDMYGYGGSPFPPNPENYTISDEVAFVESLIREVIPPGEPFHLVGHSFGGVVALRMAHQLKERILSLTLFEPVAFHILPRTGEMYETVRQMGETIDQAVKEGKYSEAAERFVDHWSGPGAYLRFPKEFRAILDQGIKKLSIENRALRQESLSLDDYRKINIPALLIVGEKSPTESKQIAEIFAEHLPRWQINRLDVDHMAPVTQPEKVNPVIETFIRQW